MKDSKRHSSGIAAVEFLIVLPVLLLVFSAIVEFGNLFIQYNILNKSVQNAARYSVVDLTGSINPDGIADREAIKNMVVYGQKTIGKSSLLKGLTTDNVNIDVEGKYVFVKVIGYKYDPIFNYIPIKGFLDIELKTSSVMRTGL